VFSTCLLVFTSVEEDTSLVVDPIVDVIFALVTFAAVFLSVVFSEVRLSEEDVV